MNDTTRTISHDHAHDAGDLEAHGASAAEQIVYYISGIIALFLGLRFLFILMGVNNTGIVNWVYQITQPFVAPFYGIMGTTVIYGNARIEWESLWALLALTIITFIIVGFLRLITRTR